MRSIKACSSQNSSQTESPSWIHCKYKEYHSISYEIHDQPGYQDDPCKKYEHIKKNNP